MKTITIFTCLIAMMFSSFAQYNTKNLSIPDNAEDNYTFKNLRLFPIRANQQFLDTFKNVGKYTTLAKALEEKKVVITETNTLSSSGASVNKLFISNVSGDTVLVLAGEVVKGGKQDRMIGQNFLLPPYSDNVDLSVFCVEHGRWTGGIYTNGASQFSSAQNYGSNTMRKIAIVNKDQSAVWKEVGNVTGANSAVTSSGTYNALKESKDYKEKLDAYISFFKNAIKGQDNIIGFVACSGDSVIGCDMFATIDMFAGQLDNLLQSYSTDAMTNGSTPTVDKAKAQAFLDKFLKDEKTQETEVNKSGSILKNKGVKLMISKF